MLGECLNISAGGSFSRISFIDWVDLFKEFLEWKRDNKRVVIILDEFPYLIELDKGVISQFQKAWDLYLSRREDVMLILCGSSVGMVETEVLGYRSPLHGRRTGQWRVLELKLHSIQEFVPSYSFRDVIYVYAALGGVPAYLAKLDNRLTFQENIRRLLLRRGAELYEEAENLLRQELREPRNYKLILEAISEGKRRISEIANATGLDKAAVSRYIDTLELLDIVSYESPVLSKPKTRRRLYYIKDNYFNFWFRYIYPNKSLIEENRGDVVLEEILADYDYYVSFIFERIAKRFLFTSAPFKIHRIGRHWWRTSRGETLEIDLLGFDRRRRRYLLAEVKWSTLKPPDIDRIYRLLKYRLERLDLKGKIYYCIVGREIVDKDELRGRHSDLLLYDLADMEQSENI